VGRTIRGRDVGIKLKRTLIIVNALVDPVSVVAGVVLISAGAYHYSAIAGCFVTGTLLIAIPLVVHLSRKPHEERKKSS